jgi:S1-C subfamily serine protease
MRTNVIKYGTILLLALLALALTGCLCCLPTARRVVRDVSEPTAVVEEREEPVATPTALPPQVVQQADAEEQLLINIYKRVNPGVVHIRVVALVDMNELLPDLPDSQRIPDQYQEGTGSGFVIDQEGHIVTNNHVVADAEEVQVTFSDGTSARARVIGTDPDSDLAVIQVDVPARELYPLELGDSDRLEIGQRAIAIGNPYGLDGTLTTGIISALGRSLQLGRESEVLGNRFTIPELIQTDAAINPGNSGGPLLNSQGQVIGVNTAYDPNVSGVGFAVPVNAVKRVVPKLIAGGRYVYPWLGISGTDLSLDLVEAMNLPVERGAIVMTVTSDSPADKAGLRGSTETVEKSGRELQVGGDVIIAIDGNPVREFNDILVYIISRAEVGQQVTLTIIRDGREQSVKVTLAERPSR